MTTITTQARSLKINKLALIVAGLLDGTAAAAGDSRLLRTDNRGTCQICHKK